MTIDSAKLRHKLDAIPFDDLVDQIPDQAGELKKLLGAAVYLAPKFVITLGDAHTGVDTVQGIAIPDHPDTDPVARRRVAPPAAAPAAPPPACRPAPSAPAARTRKWCAARRRRRRPPGAEPAGGRPAAALLHARRILLLGGIALAPAAGTYLRRIGVLALGGAGSCATASTEACPTSERFDHDHRPRLPDPGPDRRRQSVARPRSRGPARAAAPARRR